MTILITGAAGFIGRRLVDVLLRDAPGHLRGQSIRVLDRALVALPDDARLQRMAGDLADPSLLARAITPDVEYVFHLASVPGGAAEADFEAGLRANLTGTIALLEGARRTGRVPRVLFASTIGVYGAPLPALIDGATPPQPRMSYGAHKFIGETLIADYTRKGFIDGVALRLPGIVARPAAGGLLSAFMSELIRELTAGRTFTVPVSAMGTAWWMSRSCVVDNFLHATTLPREILRSRSFWLLPVQRASMLDVVEALARVHGADRLALARYAPDEALEAQFAKFPPLRCPSSDAAGFRHDGSLDVLVQRALEGPGS